MRPSKTRDYNDTLRTYGTARITDAYPNNEFYFIVFILRIIDLSRVHKFDVKPIV